MMMTRVRVSIVGTSGHRQSHRAWAQRRQPLKPGAPAPAARLRVWGGGMGRIGSMLARRASSILAPMIPRRPALLVVALLASCNADLSGDNCDPACGPGGKCQKDSDCQDDSYCQD